MWYRYEFKDFISDTNDVFWCWVGEWSGLWPVESFDLNFEGVGGGEVLGGAWWKW